MLDWVGTALAGELALAAGAGELALAACAACANSGVGIAEDPVDTNKGFIDWRAGSAALPSKHRSQQIGTSTTS